MKTINYLILIFLALLIFNSCSNTAIIRSTENFPTQFKVENKYFDGKYYHYLEEKYFFGNDSIYHFWIRKNKFNLGSELKLKRIGKKIIIIKNEKI